MVDFRKAAAIRRDDLLYRHPLSLYEDHPTEAHVVHLLRRGEFLIRDGTAASAPSRGIFLRPAGTR